MFHELLTSMACNLRAVSHYQALSIVVTLPRLTHMVPRACPTRLIGESVVFQLL